MDNRKEEILKEAVYSTYDSRINKYSNSTMNQGIEQAIGALKSYMLSGYTRYFTRTDNARMNVSDNISREEMADYLADYIINIARTKKTEDPEEQLAFFQIGKYELLYNDGLNEVKKAIMQCFLGQRGIFESYKASDFSNFAVNLFVRDTVGELYKEKRMLEQETVKNTDPRYGVRNFRVNRGVYNYCREELFNGRQIQIQNEIKAENLNQRPRRDYNLNDEMMAVTDIGERRNNQEDSISMLYHPSNPKYKMLMVADGMGGTVAGEMASSEAAREMSIWFESLPESMMLESQRENLKEMWDKKLNEINTRIIQKYPRAGTTFVGAIVGEKATTIASIGDSRAYILGNDNQLAQVTVDDNMEFIKWKNKWDKYIKQIGRGLTYDEILAMEREKDSLRFHVDANQITNCLGIQDHDIRPHFFDVPNDKYKTLMLFSDGVTDCLSDSQLMAITRNTKAKDLAKRIVDSAIQNISTYYGDNQHHQVINGGKDNTSAVILNNNLENER